MKRALFAATVGALFAIVLAVSAPAGSQVVRCGSLPATIVGSSGDDVLVGTPQRDVIAGLAGRDIIDGGGGPDVICGGSGRDRISGGDGRDYLNGGPGRDRLLGNRGADILVGGSGRDHLRGGSGNDRVRGGAGTDSCIFEVAIAQCERVTGRPVRPPAARTVERVIHVSLDGLRADHVTGELMPHLSALFERGASTLNARTDPDRTLTLPNHHSQLTGRAVEGEGGHMVTYNVDRGRTVHEEAGRYVSSVFDVVHDNGGRTAVLVGKSKFDMITRNWNTENGAPDLIGADDGTDKIDVYLRQAPDDAVDALLDTLTDTNRIEFVFFHVRSADERGHESGWSSDGYRVGVREADEVVGDLLAVIDRNPVWARSTAIIVTADHGGPAGERSHHDESLPGNFVVPFGVWLPGIDPGGDLYELNDGRRRDPGSSQPPLTGPQPIRTHEVANLALDLLGYGPVPGSTFNSDQDLRIGRADP